MMRKVTVILVVFCGSLLTEGMACSVSVSGYVPTVRTQTGHIEIDGVKVSTFTMDSAQPAYQAQHDIAPKAIYTKGLDKKDLAELIAYPVTYHATPIDEHDTLAKWFQQHTPTIVNQWILVPKGWLHVGSTYSGGESQRGDCSMARNGVPKALFYNRDILQNEGGDNASIYSLAFSATTSNMQAKKEAKLYQLTDNIGTAQSFGRGEFGSQVKWIDDKTLSYRYNEKTIKVAVERLNQHTLSYNAVMERNHQWIIIYFNKGNKPLPYWNLTVNLPKEQAHLADTIRDWVMK